jgi:hypothetical protein
MTSESQPPHPSPDIDIHNYVYDGTPIPWSSFRILSLNYAEDFHEVLEALQKVIDANALLGENLTEPQGHRYAKLAEFVMRRQTRFNDTTSSPTLVGGVLMHSMIGQAIAHEDYEGEPGSKNPLPPDQADFYFPNYEEY